MKINRQELLSVLQNMQSTEKVNFKENIIYQIENDIMIYNKFFDKEVKENFSLPIKNLITILSKLKDKEIELLIEDNIFIKSKKTKIKITKEKIKDDYEFINPFTWIDLPEDFLKGIEFVGKIVEENNRVNSVLFIDNNKIVTTNGKVLIIYNLNIDFNKFFLLKNQIDLLTKLKVKKYFVSDNLIYFLAANNSIIYFNYLTDYKFPPYEKIKMKDEKEIKFLDKLNLNDIEINTSILDQENKLIDIEIKKDNIFIKNNNTNINIETKLEKQNDIEETSFRLDIYYLIEFLKSDYSNEFKTFLDETKICFKNPKIIFMTVLRD